MKIIRWLLSHFILILLIVAVIYGYMFWGNLAGENTPVGKAITYLSNEFVDVGEFVNAVKTKHAQVSEEHADKSLEANASAFSEESKKTDDFSSAAQDVATRDTNRQPVSIAYSHSNTQVEQNSAGFIEQKADTQPDVASTDNIDSYNAQVNQSSSQQQYMQPHQAMTDGQGNASSKSAKSPAVANRAVGEQGGILVPPASDAFISEQVAKQIDNVDKNGKVIDPSMPVSDVRNSWLTARKSYYQRNYDVSEKNYQYVIDNTEDNFDAYGELGNVYFNQGKNKQAAAAYFSAASILVRKGHIRRAESLVGLLRHLDKDKAEELQKLITSAAS